MNLINSLPRFYRKSEYANAIQTALGNAVEDLKTTVEAKKNNAGILEADETAVKRYEKIFGIKNQTDDLTTRKQRILFLLCGCKNITAAKLAKIIEIYDAGSCTITEDYANYKITVSFGSVLGIPRDIDAIKDIVRKIIPAHIDVGYKYNLRTWNWITTNVETWNGFAGTTWDEARTLSGSDDI